MTVIPIVGEWPTLTNADQVGLLVSAVTACVTVLTWTAVSLATVLAVCLSSVAWSVRR